MNAMKKLVASTIAVATAGSLAACHVEIRTQNPGGEPTASGTTAPPPATTSTETATTTSPAATSTTTQPASVDTTALQAHREQPRLSLKPVPLAPTAVPLGKKEYPGGTVPNLLSAKPTVYAFGSTASSGGLWAGDVYFPDTATTKFPDVPKSAPALRLFTNSLNIGPNSGFAGFTGAGGRKNNFLAVYNGPIVVNREVEYEVRLVSADGAKLYIDEMLIIDNDGEHEPVSKTQLVRLVKATHSMRVEYFHAKSQQVALQLYIRPTLSKSEYLLTATAWTDAATGQPFLAQ